MEATDTVDATPATVLLVSSSSFLGGAERSLLELARELAFRGRFSPVLACPGGGRLPEVAASDGLRVLGFDLPRLEGTRGVDRAAKALGFAGAARRLRRHILDTGARLLHANGLKAGVAGLAAARWAGIPSILHVRDFPRRRGLHRAVTPWADAVVAPSRFLADALLDAGAGKARVIPNPVARLGASAWEGRRFREDWGISEDKPLVTMIAQFVPWKRHDLFLDAAARIRDAHFLIAGTNPWSADTACAERIAADAHGVTVVGHRDDIDAVLAASTVLVLPSEDEPFGRVVVEAWWMGVPVVVSDCGGPAELVRHEDSGLHFARGNISALVRALERVLSDDGLRRRLIARGREAAAAYLPDIHAGAVATLYEALLR